MAHRPTHAEVRRLIARATVWVSTPDGDGDRAVAAEWRVSAVRLWHGDHAGHAVTYPPQSFTFEGLIRAGYDVDETVSRILDAGDLRIDRRSAEIAAKDEQDRAPWQS